MIPYQSQLWLRGHCSHRPLNRAGRRPIRSCDRPHPTVHLARIANLTEDGVRDARAQKGAAARAHKKKTAAQVLASATYSHITRNCLLPSCRLPRVLHPDYRRSIFASARSSVLTSECVCGA